MVPSLFIGHGSPMLALEENAYVDFLRELGQKMPRPRAVVIFTAHWEAPVQQVSRVEGHYEMIYDFGGFPDELYQVVYPAKGDPVLADEVKALLESGQIRATPNDKRGIDHGTWVVLRMLFPDADVPVVQMSVNPMLSNEEQYKIGQALHKLREQDVLVIGSGGTVHNLWAVDWQAKGSVSEWAVQFDSWLADRLMGWKLEELFAYETLAPQAKMAVPRNEHFIPLLLAMGAGDDEKQAERLFQAYQMGSLSLNVWQFGSFKGSHLDDK